MVGEVIAGRYELQELLGTGGMASVYRAYDRLLERTVAIKVLHDRYSDDDEYVERFRREARAAARLSHPNIVTVIDRGEQDGRQFIVFEHVGGETLKHLVERSGPIPIGDALELAIQVGRALSFAHEHGLVHRDVKPQNVLLNGRGVTKVTDFGIARAVDIEEATTTGTVVGTSHYLSPEQARGQKADPQSDVYSLGAVLYELLAGQVVFPGDNFVTVAMRHVREPVPSLLEKRPEVSVRLASAVERALEKQPARRFGSMEEFVAELQACLDELGEDRDQEPTLIVPSPASRARPRRGEVDENHQVALPGKEAGGEGARRSRRPIGLVIGGLVIAALATGLYLARIGPLGGHSPGPPIALTAVASYDPFGDNGSENDSLVPNATDGNPSSAWQTETYYDRVLTKKGVGIVLETRRPSEPRELTVTSDTPGFRALVKASNRRDGGFEPISGSLTVERKTTFGLHPSSPTRYFLIWITNLGHHEHVDVNGVKARG